MKSTSLLKNIKKVNLNTMDNIDIKEVIKFDNHAENWWDKEGDLKTLHHINPARLEFIQNYISLKEKKICDIGCGGGILSESLAKLGAEVTGIDMSEKAIETAQHHAQFENLNINYITISAENFVKDHTESFDAVTCMELLEHVPDPVQLIKSCSALVKPNGGLFFSTLNRNFKAYFLSILGAEYFLRIIPKGTHDYARFIKPSELAQAARDAGLKVSAISGMTYNPFTQQCKLSNDHSVNYLVYLTKNI